MKRKHFTLIELLVVIAIIAILASMLLPSLGKAKSMAKMMECGKQLHQVAQSLASYCNDYNGYFPPDINSNTWTAKARSYWGDRGTGVIKMLQCSSSATKLSGYWESHYGMSSTLINCGDWSGVERSMNLSRAKKPSSTMQIVCAPKTYRFSNSGDMANLSITEVRHNGRMPLVYMDSHLENKLYLEIPKGASMSSDVFWTP